jgi:hypothetical protein
MAAKFPRQGLSIDDLIDFTPELREQALEAVSGYSFGPLFSPPVIRDVDRGIGGQPVFRAHDKATGAIVAEIELPATQTGLPMSYAIDDEQFIVMAIAGPGQPAELVVLKLP